MSKLTTTSEHKCQHIYWYLHTFYLMSVHWKHFSYFQFIACILHFALWFVHNPLLYNYSNIINVYMPKCSLDIAISSALLSIKSIIFVLQIFAFFVYCAQILIYIENSPNTELNKFVYCIKLDIYHGIFICYHSVEVLKLFKAK